MAAVAADAGLESEIEVGDGPKPVQSGIKLLIQNRKKTGGPQQIAVASELPAPERMGPKSGLKPGIFNGRPRQHDDIQGLNVVILEEVLLPKVLVKTVEGGLTREHAGAVQV